MEQGDGEGRDLGDKEVRGEKGEAGKKWKIREGGVRKDSRGRKERVRKEM